MGRAQNRVGTAACRNVLDSVNPPWQAPSALLQRMEGPSWEAHVCRASGGPPQRAVFSETRFTEAPEKLEPPGA